MKAGPTPHIIKPEGTSQDYFDALYSKDNDPFRSWPNAYEDRKRSLALSMLNPMTYGSIFEPGCGNGAFSRDLAPRTLKLLAADWSLPALDAARAYCGACKNINFQQLNFPFEIPNERFDLMVVSELLYYFSQDTLALFYQRLDELLHPGSEILLVHWRGLSADYPAGGDAVNQDFEKHPRVRLLNRHEDSKFLISLGKWR